MIYSFKASPKAISRRTSYIRVRLEFLRYPQLIPCLFNDNEFGPPLDFTQASAWPWIGHPVSGLRHATIALFRLAFASAPNLQFLTSLHNVTRRSVLQKVRGRTLIVLPLLVNTGFQVLFHSPPGVLFNFPSRYCSTIGHQVVFSLTGWSPLIHTRFHVSCTTLDTTMSTYLSYTRLSLSMVYFSK